MLDWSRGYNKWSRRRLDYLLRGVIGALKKTSSRGDDWRSRLINKKTYSHEPDSQGKLSRGGDVERESTSETWHQTVAQTSHWDYQN